MRGGKGDGGGGGGGGGVGGDETKGCRAAMRM